MLHYTVTEAKAKFAEIVAKAMAGEEIILTKMGKEAARIVPPKKQTNSRLGFMKGHFYMAEDFDVLPDEIARAFGMIE